MAHVADFAAGRVNLLIATRTAEEGFDIPAANCVFRFDPIDHSVSYVQGRGRARAEGSSYTILAERADRPASMLAAAETQQLAIIASMQTPAGGAEAGGDGGRATWEAAERTAQLSRERNAAAKLRVTLGLEAQHSIALAELNLFCKRTKVELAEAVTAAPGGVAGNLVSMEYSSCLRTVRGEGQGATLKAARQAAAANLLARLAASLAAGAAAGASKAASAAAVPLRTV